MATAFSDLTSVRTAAFDEIPIVDFGAALRGEPDAKAAAARALRNACENVGFFYIRNHGIPDADIERTFDIGRRFFALPLENKLSIHKNLSPQHAGFTPLLAENTDASNDGDLHESFDMVSPLARFPSSKATGADVNLWPEALPELKASLDRYFGQVLELGKRLFEMVALSLGLPEDFFRPHLTHPMGMLRINSYPPQTAQSDSRQIGIGAHTDYECFTILAQQPGITALQVWNGREWIKAPPIPGTFVVNIADLLQRWSNDAFLSTRHRAINVSGAARLSIPFFLGVNYDTTISPLPGCVSAERPGKYPPVIAGDYILQRLNETYGMAGEAPSPSVL
jgi:isopenicillin N synthase-like dioxygenase